MFTGGKGRACDRAEGPGRWIGSFRFATALIYVALNLGLVQLHANEEFYPHSTREWADPTKEHHHGHNHAACLVFWISAPSPAPLPVPAQIHQGHPVPREPEPAASPPPFPWRKGPLPRGPPLTA
jgi:hypothetical protein